MVIQHMHTAFRLECRHRRGIGHAVRRCGDRGTECGECGASRHRQSRLPKATGIQMIAFQQT